MYLRKIVQLYRLDVPKTHRHTHYTPQNPLEAKQKLSNRKDFYYQHARRTNAEETKKPNNFFFLNLIFNSRETCISRRACAICYYIEKTLKLVFKRTTRVKQKTRSETRKQQNNNMKKKEPAHSRNSILKTHSLAVDDDDVDDDYYTNTKCTVETEPESKEEVKNKPYLFDVCMHLDSCFVVFSSSSLLLLLLLLSDVKFPLQFKFKNLSVNVYRKRERKKNTINACCFVRDVYVKLFSSTLSLPPLPLSLSLSFSIFHLSHFVCVAQDVSNLWAQSANRRCKL